VSRSPTFSETRDSLHKICEAAQRGLFDLGRCREAYDEEALSRLVISTSKAILEHLPCLQFETDDIEYADSNYGYVLNCMTVPESLVCPPDQP